MAPQLKILRDLAAGQSTADSIAPRIGLPTAATEVILQRMKKEGTVQSKPLGGVLEKTPVYFLTPSNPNPEI